MHKATRPRALKPKPAPAPTPALPLPAPEPVARPFVAYYRVSTERQGRSGLGLDAQREAVARYLASRQAPRLLAEFTEQESGTRGDRPELARALAMCRASGAVLIVGKLDRLSHNARFLLGIVEGSGEGGVVFCDLPQIPDGPVGKFIVTQLAAVAELERGLISARTKAALAAWKERHPDRKLGNPRLVPGNPRSTARARAARTVKCDDKRLALVSYIEQARRAGATSLREIASAMMARGIRAPGGGMTWHAATVLVVLRRAERGEMREAA